MSPRFDSRLSLRAAYETIERSRSPRTGGARAFYTPLRGWSPTYSEATGILIETVVRAAETLKEPRGEALARSFGEFLLDIQHPDGGWHAGMWPPRRTGRLGAFTTAQIVHGLCQLYRFTRETQWLESAQRGAEWLTRTVGDGEPTYYTQVAWAMLEHWSLTGDSRSRNAAIGILDSAASRRTILGAFNAWGFYGSDAAFTHTIGYVLRGFIESARLLDAWPRYGKPLRLALLRLAEDALASKGRLPGAYDSAWQSERQYTCSSGNAQIALALLSAYRFLPDERFVHGARSLVDEVARRQVGRERAMPALRGAIPASYPLWGRYLPGRYPVWTAKYLCDAIVALAVQDHAEARDADQIRAASPAVAFSTI